MAAGLQAGDLLLQPRDHFIHDETPKRFAAGVILLTGLHVEMIDQGESDGRQRIAVEQGLENGQDLHLLQIKFAIQKEAEPLGLIGGAAQQMDGAGITHGGIRDGVRLELDGPLWFWFRLGHARLFNYKAPTR
jgi:hypothetical protein